MDDDDDRWRPAAPSAAVGCQQLLLVISVFVSWGQSIPVVAVAQQPSSLLLLPIDGNVPHGGGKDAWPPPPPPPTDVVGNALLQLSVPDGNDDGGDHVQEQGLSQRLVANYSIFGKAVPVFGYVVQLHPLRACELRTAGVDSTLKDHVAVVITKGVVEPFMAGCVSPYNQAKFAQESGAKGIILDVDNLKPHFVPSSMVEWPVLDIAVLTSTGQQSELLHEVLARASKLNAPVTVSAKPAAVVDGRHVPFDGSLFKDMVASSVFDKAVLPAILVFLFFVVVIGAVKMRERVKSRRARRDGLPIRKLAQEALNKMTVKKFDGPSAAGAALLDNNSRLSINGCDLCAICLEIYRPGQTLRVISCGHEFHKGCVDPWLLNNRTCPLCLFDVVLEKHRCNPPRVEQPAAPASEPPAVGSSVRQGVVVAVRQEVQPANGYEEKARPAGGNQQQQQDNKQKKRRYTTINQQHDYATQKRLAKRNNRVAPRFGGRLAEANSKTQRPQSSSLIDGISEGYLSDISAITDCWQTTANAATTGGHPRHHNGTALDNNQPFR